MTEAAGGGQYLTWFVFTLPSILGFGLVTYFMRKWINGVDTKLDQVIQQEHECRESLPLRFGSKESVEKLWERADRQAERLSFLEGVRNGSNSRKLKASNP